MFTGIIKEIGKVSQIVRGADSYKFEVESKGIYKNINTGDSVSVNGVCLTLTKKKKNILSFDVVAETACVTNLVDLVPGDAVNLEDSLKAGDPVGGHFVLGHVDCQGKITGIKKEGKNFWIEITIPQEFNSLVVTKGSIAVDGISLTIGDLLDNAVRVYVIPHTLEMTALSFKKAGHRVNIEFDILGKYILRYKGSGPKGKITESFLEEKGFGTRG